MAIVLVVDDSRLVLDAVSGALRRDGHMVLVTENPLEVPHLLRRTRPDVVLVDLEMPTLRGDVVVRILRRTVGAGPVVLLHTETKVPAAEATACGADGVLAKSRDLRPLCEAVRTAVLAPPVRETEANHGSGV